MYIGAYLILSIFIYVWLRLITREAVLLITPKNKIRRIAMLGKVESDLWARLFDWVMDWIKYRMPGVFPYGAKRIELLKRRLNAAGVNQKAENYLIKKSTRAISALVMGWFLSILTKDVQAVSYFFGGCSLILALVIYKAPDYELLRLKEKKDERIVLELPRFIRTIRYSPENKPLIAIVRDYLKISKEGLSVGLQRLLGDLELNMPEEKALQRFAEHIESPEVREMVSVLRVTLNASRQESLLSLMFIENKLTEKARRIVQRDLDRRPELLETLNDILLYALGLVFLVPMAINMFAGLSSFME